jgi:FAD/FMN-containing dehydrogenase
LKEHIGLKPIVDTTRPMSYVELQRQHEDRQVPCFATSKSAFLRELTDEIQDILIDAIVNEGNGVQHSIIPVVPFNGAISDLKTSDTAFPHRSANWWVAIAGVADSQSTVEDAEKWTTALKTKMQPHSLGSYVNSIGLNKSVDEASYFISNLKRLRTIKYRYDPENIFHNNHNITPAAAADDDAEL